MSADSSHAEPPVVSGLRSLVRLSGSLATRDPVVIRGAMEEALAGCRPDHVEEVLLQAHLFLGYPSALEGFALWRELSGRPAGALGEEEADWEARGEEVCRRVYGTQYERLRRNVVGLHPALDRWMISEGYGRVLARPALDLPTRELAIVGLLAVLDAPVQLYSHMRGALSVGVPFSTVEVALRAVEEFMSEEGEARAWECLARVRDAQVRA